MWRVTRLSEFYLGGDEMGREQDVLERRKDYCKPRMERVRLIPNESVLAACKGASVRDGIGQTTPVSCDAFGCYTDSTS